MQSADCILSPMQSADCAGSQIACNMYNALLLELGRASAVLGKKVCTNVTGHLTLTASKRDYALPHTGRFSSNLSGVGFKGASLSCTFCCLCDRHALHSESIPRSLRGGASGTSAQFGGKNWPALFG